MKRVLTIMACLAMGAALAAIVAQRSPKVRALFGWTSPPELEKTAAIQALQAGAKDVSKPSGTGAQAPEGSINMPPEMIEAQGIETAAAGEGTLARMLAVPGTITLDPGRVARVPGRVEGTVTEMRKRLGDTVRPGEVVAVLDSREVADAKSEYLTASVARDLQKILLERQQILWAQKSNAELQYIQAQESFRQAELRFDLARQKLVALNLDPAEVAKAAMQESSPSSGVSSLRQYEIRSLSGGRVIERKVNVGQLVGRQGDPSDLYTVADLSVVWVEMAVPIADLETVDEGQPVGIAGGRESGKRGDGRIIFISPLVDPDTRSARVVAELDNKGMTWRPGAAVTATIAIEQNPAEILIPRSAIETIGNERVVFVRTPAGFQMRAVTTGRSDEHSAEITSGLTAGEQIAVRNTFLLKAELEKRKAEEGD